MRLSKNKRTKTLLQRKGKKQSKLIKLHNLGAQPAPALDLGPHVARLRHRCTPACAGMWLGFEAKACVCVPVCVRLECYCVQLQKDRTSVGCGQAGSERRESGSGQEVIVGAL